jgi:thiamine-phosphate pyrophosphorylase
MIRYLITDPNYYSNKEKLLEYTLNNVLKKHKVDMVCFRDKISKNFEQLALVFLHVCQKHKIDKILLNSNIDLAIKLGFYGVQIPSNNIKDIKKAKENNLFVIASCHNDKQIEAAIFHGADMITFSPIFEVQKGQKIDQNGNLVTFKKDNPKGIELLKEVANKYPIDTIALGGIITNDHVEKIKKTKAKGFASIRYFL